METKCKFCGAAMCDVKDIEQQPLAWPVWKCGTRDFPHEGMSQSDKCRADELESRVKELEARLEFLQVLLERGWTIRWVNDHIEYRRPDGLSGSMYHAENFRLFPEAVRDWIVENIPIRPNAQ